MDHPAILLVGPRACGKTTTAYRHCADRLRLDRPAEAAVVRADPDAAIADGPFPLLIDEWQAVPGVLGAVKRAVDDGASSGSFILTGSSQADLTVEGWPATGRLIRLAMYGLTERELDGDPAKPPIIELADSRVIGIEVQADAAPDQRSAAHLRWLRDAIGSRFLLGLVLHTGPRAFRFDHSILALPICALWT